MLVSGALSLHSRGSYIIFISGLSVPLYSALIHVSSRMSCLLYNQGEKCVQEEFATLTDERNVQLKLPREQRVKKQAWVVDN